jgi:Tfp pilus assembly protein PilX
MLNLKRQRGVVLFLSLIVLVVLMLGGLALFRNVDTSILISGNVALQKNATRSGDGGAEAAITWLQANTGAPLFNDVAGYVAAGLANPKSSSQTWPQYWEALVQVYPPVTLATDAAGNTASYLIQRLCNLTGQPYSAGPPPVECIEPPSSSSTGSSKGASSIELNRPTSVYYRITVRTTGPKNSVSFIQTTVLM